jgi:hypothetical protein
MQAVGPLPVRALLVRASDKEHDQVAARLVAVPLGSVQKHVGASGAARNARRPWDRARTAGPSAICS